MCRMQRRLAFRNERRLFKGKSALSGKPIFTLYDAENSRPIYEEQEWWSDAWDPLSHGRPYDFSRPFFEQFRELLHVVPQYNRSVINIVHSEYSANAGDLKNCYLCFNANESEDSGYSNGLDYSKDCFDCSHVNKCERCLESFWLQQCYTTLFSSQCEGCAQVLFSKNCIGCSDCFGCVNLRNKKYHIFNRAYSVQEYKKQLAARNLGSHNILEETKKMARDFWKNFPVKFAQSRQNTNATGDYIFNSKNIKQGYLIRGGENLAYCQYMQVAPNKDCYDHSVWGGGNELTYECTTCGINTYNIKFCIECWPETRNLEYCASCHSTKDCFGCVGLRNKQYCILNQQYPKEAYEELVARIKRHMADMPYTDKRGRVYAYGEFFPIEFSPFAYNDTTAQDHMVLNKEAAAREGYRWRDAAKKEYETTLDAKNIQDHISDVSDGIFNEILKCSVCGKGYRVIPPELAFYRKANIALPRSCPDCRHDARMQERNRAAFCARKCQCMAAASTNGAYKNTATHPHGNIPCTEVFETSYAPEQPEIVYCENCYNAEVA